MKVKIPVWQLKENISGVRIDKMNNAFITSMFDEINKLHRNDHFICLTLLSGRANLLIDFKNVDIHGGDLAFLFPGQIQRGISFEKAEGWILFLDHKLVDDHARLVIEDSIFGGSVLSLSNENFQWFKLYFELLYQTYNEHSLGSLHKQALNGMIIPCICKIAAAFRANTEAQSGTHSPRSMELTKKFKKLARDHYRDLRKPGDYAGLMNLSLSYLNDTIKSVTGFTTSYFIQQEMLKESQRLLWYTDLSIKEIATYLGYDDTKYFNRLFTKLAGISPGRFRTDFKSENKRHDTN